MERYGGFVASGIERLRQALDLLAAQGHPELYAGVQGQEDTWEVYGSMDLQGYETESPIVGPFPLVSETP